MSKIFSNTTDLQAILQSLQNKADGGSSSESEEIVITVGSASNARLSCYVDSDTNSPITTKIGPGYVFKPFRGAVAMVSGEVSSSTCEYITCTLKSGYFMHIFLSSGSVEFT